MSADILQSNVKWITLYKDNFCAFSEFRPIITPSLVVKLSTTTTANDDGSGVYTSFPPLSTRGYATACQFSENISQCSVATHLRCGGIINDSSIAIFTVRRYALHSICYRNSVCMSVCPSVRLSVCHTRGLCPHGSTYDHDFFTIW